MSAAAEAWRLETYARLASTSDLCRDRAQAGEAAGLAVRADEQTAGRGTQGRLWVSPPGNLYLSVLLRPRIPPREAPQIAPGVGALVAAALQPFAPAKLEVKWPNDVLLDGAKLAGILVESAASGASLDWLVIGIGANLATAPTLPDRPTATLSGALTAPAAAAVILDALTPLLRL